MKTYIFHVSLPGTGRTWCNLDTTEFQAMEETRLLLQQKLDAGKTQDERNKMGQFATPTELAFEIINYAKTLIPASEQIRFLDPAFGTGSFYSALMRSFSCSQVKYACGYEIDHYYGEKASEFWYDSPLDLKLGDFTKIQPPDLDNKKFNLISCNPPYVRHHYLTQDDKLRLRRLIRSQIHYRLNGLAGLYCYFLLLSQRWMSQDGLAGWLIPGEFLDVNYGNVYLLLYPKPILAKQIENNSAILTSIWHELRQIPSKDLIAEGRVYGGGLHKIEPNELANTKITGENILRMYESSNGVQLSLF